MPALLEKQKAKIDSIIRQSSGKCELDALIASIDLDDLQSMLCHYVTNQKSPEKVTKMYYGSQSIFDTIGTDCVQYALTFLDYLDMCNSTGVCKTFSDLLPPIKDTSRARALTLNPAFTEYLFGDWRGSFVIGYALQHRYDDFDLNEFSFEQMGERNILKDEDQEIWTICRHHGFETKLVPWFLDGDDDEMFVKCHQGPFGSNVSEFHSVPPEWDVLKGTNSLDPNWMELNPAVVINCADRLWRDHFAARNIGENIYECFLSVHPLFSEYRDWNASELSDEYLIGYCSPLDYPHQYPALPDHLFTELGRRGELRGFDAIIWRLCKHFGFEMTSFLMIDRPDRYVMEWNKITDDQFDAAEIDWNESDADSDWYQPSWNKVWNDQLPKMNGIDVWGSRMSYWARPVLQMRFRKH